jgi:beta-mannosidase
MTVPGDILSSLVSSGEAPDPYYDRNELGLQWVGREDWLIERDFDVPASLLEAERLFVELDMIDTLADISVNGEALGSSENMFTSFRVDAKRLLRAGKNHIAVLIRSPETAAMKAAEELPYPIPATGAPVFSPNRNLVRKAQCMAGWDWGPCLMTGGIYDGARLVAIDGPRIEYVTTWSKREGDTWRLWTTAWLDCPADCDVEIEASIAGSSVSARVHASAGESSATIEIGGISAESWYPAGYGEQKLYELALRARRAGDGDSGDELRKRIGLRELKVVALPDEVGRSMTVTVNGRGVFCKGANWIPADALPSRWSRARYAELLDSAIEANMNCIRVWGGGRYEADDFYELCDEKGILVWQDCMFACSMYPSDQAFLDRVELEMRHQVRRLQSHPSIALWCGNNENLGAIGWYPEAKLNLMRYIVDYDRLNEGTVGRVVHKLDPGRTWWPTSPCGGPSDYADNWHSDGKGDMHFWSVWHEGKNFSEYLKVTPRFCSEFGFQSFPNPGTVASFAPEGERNVTCPTMEHHQKNNRGNALIMETIARYFRMPAGQVETLYLSQVQQAWAIKTAVEYWRSLRPVCMGTLYWQLNDVWPVASWSSLDYDGSWKLLHYEARRFYESLHLELIIKDDFVAVVAINDKSKSYTGRLALKLRSLDGKVIQEYKAESLLPPDSATELIRLEIAKLPAAVDSSFLEAKVDLARASCGSAGTERGGTGLSRKAFCFLTEPKRCSLCDPELDSRMEEGPNGPELALRAKAPAFYVAPWLDGSTTIKGRFEDSGFHLMPGEERRLLFIPARGMPMPSAERLEAALRLLHLRASYG